jgi:hypothetical protein
MDFWGEMQMMQSLQSVLPPPWLAGTGSTALRESWEVRIVDKYRFVFNLGNVVANYKELLYPYILVIPIP